MEKINHGAQGSVFKLVKGSKVYAVKTLKISEEKAIELKDKLKKKLTIENTTNALLKEIFFAKFIKKINKNHFLYFHKYKIRKCPDYKPEFIKSIHDTKEGKIMYENELSKKYCLDLVYDLKDGTFSEIYNNLNKNEFISMIIQILYATYIMHSNYFYHTDIRTTNICYCKTKLTHIKILKYNIPTFGYIWSLIDYGSIWSTNFLYKNMLEEYLNARRNFSYEDNIVMLIHVFLYNGDYLKNPDLFDIVRIFYKIINKIEYNKKLSEENINFYNKNANKNFELDDTKYFIKNITNERKLIKYFYNKLDNHGL